MINKSHFSTDERQHWERGEHVAVLLRKILLPRARAPPFHPPGHHSLMTDQSRGPYVVMSCSLRVNGRGLAFPSVWVCGTFQCSGICMVVRRTINPRSSSAEKRSLNLVPSQGLYISILFFSTSEDVNDSSTWDILNYLRCDLKRTGNATNPCIKNQGGLLGPVVKALGPPPTFRRGG